MAGGILGGLFRLRSHLDLQQNFCSFDCKEFELLLSSDPESRKLLFLRIFSQVINEMSYFYCCSLLLILCLVALFNEQFNFFN